MPRERHRVYNIKVHLNFCNPIKFTLVFIVLCSCSVMKQEVNYKDPQSYEFKKRVWQVNEHEGAIIIAIHGYNDYSESFQRHS